MYAEYLDADVVETVKELDSELVVCEVASADAELLKQAIVAKAQAGVDAAAQLPAQRG